MFRRLRIGVSVGQAVLAATIVIVANHSHDQRVYESYVSPGLHIVTKMNGPLVVVLFPILYLTHWLGENLPSLDPLLLVGVAVLQAGFLLLSVGVFWYFVVTEVELRSRGSSMLRSGKLLRDGCLWLAFSVFGMAAIYYAYADGTLLLRIRGSIAEALVGGLFLVTWGFVLIAVSIQDLRKYLRNRNRGPDHSVHGAGV